MFGFLGYRACARQEPGRGMRKVHAATYRALALILLKL